MENNTYLIQKTCCINDHKVPDERHCRRTIMYGLETHLVAHYSILYLALLH